MDRCALFVDAGYLLADGAMAVHGTRHREAVSWDYPGLLQLMTNLSRERTGLPLLRCYWYEATVEGRRTPEHDALADIPGLKLRLSRIRPGRREGVDAQVHRDLMTLARNSAICDAVVVSGDEDLAQVVCDAQDLGIRVTVVHIAADGSWAVSRTLRQECDDLIEIGGGHLRPYVNLVTGTAESSNGHQPVSNGHAAHSLPPAPPPAAAPQPPSGPQTITPSA
ncbi:MAG: NYN domain-containing protein, partial [Nonomuraea sp.]|nr:NYN domain-containing protein [Nonomuraea sp.]